MCRECRCGESADVEKVAYIQFTAGIYSNISVVFLLA